MTNKAKQNALVLVEGVHAHEYASGKIFFLFSVFFLASLMFVNILVAQTTSSTKAHSVSTQEFIRELDKNPEVKKLLIKSIEKAKEINPDRRTNPAQTLEEYYSFLDWSEKCMPWNVLPDISEVKPDIFDQIDQSLEYFYFLLDQPLDELKGNGKYYPSLQYVEPIRSHLIRYAKNWGAFLSTEKSWNEEYYRMALSEPRFGLNKGLYEAPENWKSFNDFFARRLKSPDVRPIASPENPMVIVSPADSEPQGIWKIDANSKFVCSDDQGVPIKSTVFQSADMLLGKESKNHGKFANGTMTHTFLNVDDYHRYHFPVSGVVREVYLIDQDDAAGGITIWDAKLQKYILASDVPGWQSIETRGCVIVDTNEYGLVAILPIGMSQISSVNFEPEVKLGAVVKKGDPLGYFLFGGSDIVMLFQDTVSLKLENPLKTHLLMGEHYGTLYRTSVKEEKIP